MTPPTGRTTPKSAATITTGKIAGKSFRLEHSTALVALAQHTSTSPFCRLHEPAQEETLGIAHSTTMRPWLYQNHPSATTMVAPRLSRSTSSAGRREGGRRSGVNHPATTQLAPAAPHTALEPALATPGRHGSPTTASRGGTEVPHRRPRARCRRRLGPTSP